MKTLYLIIFLLALIKMQGQELLPTSAFSTQGSFISEEGDLWFLDRDSKWVPFGNAYLLNRPMLSVSNAAALAAVPAWSNSLAKVVQTLGYYTPGDGGGGVYTLTARTTTNMGRFASTNSAYMWQLIPPLDGIYLRQYGAKGDDATDDSVAFGDWMHDINNKSGVINIGIYKIKPYTLEPNANLNIRGVTKFGMQQIVSASVANCAVLKRFPVGNNNHLLTFTNTSALSMFDIILDGNKAEETNLTSAALYYNNGGNASLVESCAFINSTGHGVRFAGTNCTGSIVRKCLISDVRRGLRVDSSYGFTLKDTFIRKCIDNNVWFWNSQRITMQDTTIIDGSANGLAVEGVINSIFKDSVIAGHKKSCIIMDFTPYAVRGNRFNNLHLYSANCATNAEPTVVPFPAGTYSTVLVTGANQSALQNVFSGCIVGGHDETQTPPRYGTNAVKGHFEWTGTGDTAYKPWELWSFMGNVYRPTSIGYIDYIPDLTNRVAEIGTFRSNGYSSWRFGMWGGIDANGWRMDIVPGGAQATEDTLRISPTTHAIMKQGTPIGTPTETLPVILPPPDLSKRPND